MRACIRAGFAIAVAILSSATAGAAASPLSVLGLRWVPGGVLVQRYDPATLQPSGRGLRIGANAWAWSRSPDGRTVALAGGQQDRPAIVVFVDTPTLRRMGRLRFAPGGPAGMRWLAPDRLLLVTSTESGSVVRLVDPTELRQLAQIALPGRLARGARTRDGLALLLGPQQGFGPAQLVLVDRALSVRSVPLARIEVGWEVPQPAADGSGETPARMRVPGLAVDPTGTRAVVVGAGEPVAEIDLGSSAVAYHPQLERRLALAAKSISGPELSATWLPGGKVAVTGTVYGGLDATTRMIRQDPFGLVLLDTRTWRSRLAARGVAWVVPAGGWLFSAGLKGGLDWYDANGVRRGHLFGTRKDLDWAWAGERGIARSSEQRRSFLLDLRRGRVLRIIDDGQSAGSPDGPPLFLDVEPAGFSG